MKDDYAKYYYESFLVALLIVLLPSRILAYLVPFIALTWFIVRSGSGLVLRKTFLLIFGYTLLIFGYYAVYYFQDLYFLSGNAVVAFLTYGSFIFILLLPGTITSGTYSYEKYAKLLEWVIAIQGFVGIMQFLLVVVTGKFHILAGDAVQGTIGLFAFVLEQPGFGNQMFAINMVFFLLYFLPYVLVHRRGVVALVLGFVSLLLAGVLHVFISLLAGFLFTVLFYYRGLLIGHLHKIVLAIALVILLILPVQLIMPNIFRTTDMYLSLYGDGKSPKIDAMDQAFNKLPEEYPVVYLIGLGPGQFSSRAGLMSSGEYFGSKIALLPNITSKPFVKYFQKIWHRYAAKDDSYGNSTMHRPYFSLLSVFAEFGAIGSLLFLYLAIHLFLKFRKLFIVSPDEKRMHGYLYFFSGASIIFILFVSFFENYLETTQAIFPGLMLLKVFYNLKT